MNSPAVSVAVFLQPTMNAAAIKRKTARDDRSLVLLMKRRANKSARSSILKMLGLRGFLHRTEEKSRSFGAQHICITPIGPIGPIESDAWNTK